MEVAGDEARGVGRARRQVKGVHIVAAEGKDLAAGGAAAARRGLHLLGARLGELAGQPRNAQRRHARAPRQHQRHLQQNAQLLLNGLRRAVGETLRAVAALQQEALALGHLRQLRAQRVHLARRHQRRQAAHCERAERAQFMRAPPDARTRARARARGRQTRARARAPSASAASSAAASGYVGCCLIGNARHDVGVHVEDDDIANSGAGGKNARRWRLRGGGAR